MNILRAFMGKKDQFLVLLEASASEARTSVAELRSLLKSNPSPDGPINRILQSRQRESEITDEIEECLCRGLRGKFDADEIEHLARALSRVSKGIRKFATRYQLSARYLDGKELLPQQQILESSVNTLWQMVSGLDHPALSRTQADHQELQKLEAAADKLFVSSIMDLYHQRRESLKAIMLRDLYELLEIVIDRCRSAGNIILRIVLKHT